MNTDLMKLKKSCRVGKWVMTIMTVLCVAGIIATLILYGVVARRNVQFPEAFSMSILGMSYSTEAPTNDMIAVIAVLICLKLCLYARVTWRAREIFMTIEREETPFDPKHARAMRRIAVLMLIGSFINTMSFQVGEWAVVAVIWVVAKVFDYGCILQRQSDETL